MDPDQNDDGLVPSEVIDAADDDLVDIDGVPGNPLAGVLGGGGFDLGALMEQATQMQSQMVAAQQHAAETVVVGVAGGDAVRITMTGALVPQAVEIAPSAVDPDDVEMLQDLVLAALRDAIDQANQITQGALDLGGLDLGGLLG